MVNDDLSSFSSAYRGLGQVTYYLLSFSMWSWKHLANDLQEQKMDLSKGLVIGDRKEGTAVSHLLAHPLIQQA